MERITRVSLVDSAIDQLSAAIASGRWPVGARIPSEAELCAQLDLSRASVREAVRALAHSGLLDTRQGDGTFVVASDAASVALARRLASAETQDVLEVRRALDLTAASLAAVRRTDADVANLRATYDRRCDVARSGDVRAFAAADIDFHRAVAAASHNALLVDLYGALVDVIAQTLESDRCLNSFRAGDAAHLDLLTRVGDGDSAGASAAAAAILDEQLASHRATAS